MEMVRVKALQIRLYIVGFVDDYIPTFGGQEQEQAKFYCYMAKHPLKRLNQLLVA